MIHSFHIKNYRGFKDCTIEPLERVNLITGSNNAGKTSLLEALYLNLAPGIAFHANLSSDRYERSTWLNLFRGFAGFGIDRESMLGWLFHKKDLSRAIELKSVDVQNGGTRILTMSWHTIADDQLNSINNSILQAAPDIPLKLNVHYKNFDGEEFKWSFQRSSAQMPPGHLLGTYPLRVLDGNDSRSPKEDVKWFSKLDDMGRQDELVSTLQLIEPRLKQLAVSVADGVPMIYGDIGLGRRVPMLQMGEGMVRLLSLVLEITNASGGAVLADEIENGFHHSVLTKVWRVIGEAARRSDTQIFATTHSWECIRAAHEAFLNSKTYDLRLHRLERSGESVRSVTYDKGTLNTSVEMNLEVR